MEAPELNEEFFDIMIDIFPKNLPIITMFLTSGSIEYSNKVSTARIMFYEKPIIQINKEFLEKECETVYDIACIILHEFLHKHLGHHLDDINNELKFLKRITHKHINLIFDLHVNAMLYLITGKRRAFVSFLERFYSKKKEKPLRFLSPLMTFPDFMDNYIHSQINTVVGVSYITLAEYLFPELFYDPPADEQQKPSMGVLGDGQGSGQEGVDGLIEMDKEDEDEDDGSDDTDSSDDNSGDDSDTDDGDNDNPDDISGDIDLDDLLGDHSEDAQELPPEYIETAEEVKEQLEKAAEREAKDHQEEIEQQQASGMLSPEEADKRMDYIESELSRSKNKTAGNLQSRVKNSIEDAEKRYRDNEKLKDKLRRFSEKSQASKLKSSLSSMVFSKVKITRQMNFKSRRTLGYFVNGLIPPYDIKKDKPETNVKITIYVDVSGSQLDVIPFIRMLIKDMKGYINERLFLFDAEVKEIPLSNYTKLDRVEVEYGGGTSFDSVVENVVENKFSNLLIITDGISSVTEPNQKIVKKKNINILTAYTEQDYRYCGNGLEKIEKQRFLLNDVCRM